MAMRRVTALVTTDEDLEAIREVASGPQIAGNVVVCDIDEEQIDELASRGVLIESVGEPALSHSGELAPAPAPAMAVFGTSIGASQEALDILADEGPAQTDVYVVSLSGPLLPAWRSSLVEAGATLLERLGSNEYTARMDIERVPGVRALDFIQGLRLFTGRDTVDDRELSSRITLPRFGEELVTYDAYLHAGTDAKEVEGWLHDRRVDVAGTGRRKVRFFVIRGATVLAELARHPDVAAIEEFVPPRLSNDRARALLGVDGDQSAPQERTGKGQIVAVADTGLDDAHADFAGHIVKVIARGRPGDASDPIGHGTHVAGSVVGNGSASGGSIRGIAPDAGLVFQSVLDAKGGLEGLGVDLGDLFAEAYAEGARIHSNSWGALARSAYRINSLEVDEYVHEHPDMLVVIAAGNSATAAQPVNAAPGFVDWLSVDAPGTAKNALTVGASRSDRPVDGTATFGAWWPNDFPMPPIATQPLSGDPEAMAAFSGRGPCDEQIRVKPDVVAPGTFILSTRSSIAPTKEFWAEYPQNRAYAFMGGTSMATPLVAGCAVLVRQYYCDEREHAPSAALLKATIVNGTRWLTGADAVADHPGEPNYHQGFGCVHMPTTIPAGDAGFRLEFRDGQESLAQTGSGSTYLFNADKGDLRLCLAWTDPPGRGLQNTVTLVLEHTPTKTRWVGNPHRPPGAMRWDAGNNVQVIRLPGAEAGAYRVTIVASNILFGPQPYALVVTGPLTSELTAI